MINLKKNIKFLITLFILLGLSFHSNLAYAAASGGDSGSSSGGASDKVNLYKLVLSAAPSTLLPAA